MVKLLKPIIEGEQNKKNNGMAKRSKFHAREPNPRVSHLVFPLK